jgi:mannobiose 2-epimerase
MYELDHPEELVKAWLLLPAEIKAELSNILQYWERFAIDQENGGFAGRIDQDNKVQPMAPKGSVLNARILWSFSAAYHYTGNPRYLELAGRAYRYIRKFLTDPVHGGLYWSVDHQGLMLDGRKQIYAQAFGIYGMSEYYRVSKDADALETALEWQLLIEKHSRDHQYGGYIDAFARDWSYLDDKRLSGKDENAPKTMNTHLHLVEAYANLYEVCPSESLRMQIEDLLTLFDEKIIDKSSHHLGLFFSNDWKMDSSLISYGHDIEAGWLLQSCAESIRKTDSVTNAKRNAILITDAAMEGLDADGGLWYEYLVQSGELVREKHWWPQAEALIGFCNAWQLTHHPRYKKALLRNWYFIRDHLLDREDGEWFWGIDGSGNKMPGQDKLGFWKCPYHNTRACLELLFRLEAF